MQRFGILASIAVAGLVWLLTSTVVHCSTINEAAGPAFRCNTDALIVFLLEHRTWPYSHAPFTGYWDSYDNKLASIIEEPYSRLFLAMAMAYLIWFRAIIYARNRHAHEKKAESVNQ
jgi:hypothetical protein